MGKRLFVGNLAWATSSEDLKQHFAAAGNVVSAEVKSGPDGRSRGFAFVEYETDAEAANAISMFDGKEMGGRPITVNEARPMTERPSGGRHNDNY